MNETIMPKGTTHFDGTDYWKQESENIWFIWFWSNMTWNRVLDYKRFHDEFGISPI